MPQPESNPEKILKNYYQAKGGERNNPLRRDVLFQQLAQRVALIRCFENIDLNSQILDVGGGDGNSLLTLLSCGFDRNNLHLIDLIEARVNKARENLGPKNIHCDDILQAPYQDGYFDVVFSSTMFLQIKDDNVALEIGTKMKRLVKPGGKIFVFDWIYDGGRKDYKAVNQKRLKRIFALDEELAITGIEKAALLPPLGRFMSKYLPAGYFLIQLFPWMTAMKGYKMTKSSGTNDI